MERAEMALKQQKEQQEKQKNMTITMNNPDGKSIKMTLEEMNKLFNHQKMEMEKMNKINENLENMVFQLQCQLEIKSQELSNIKQQEKVEEKVEVKSKIEPDFII